MLVAANIWRNRRIPNLCGSILLESRCLQGPTGQSRFSSVTSMKNLISELSNKPPVTKAFIQNAMLQEMSEEVKELNPIERDAEEMHFGSHLLRLSSHRFKSRPDVPDYLISGVRRVTETRTNRQMHIGLFKWMMSKPDELTKDLDSSLVGWAIGNRNRASEEETEKENEELNEKGEEDSKMKPNPQSRQKDKRAARDEGVPFVYGPMETISYNHYFATQNYTISQTVLEHVAALRPHFHPKRVLDFGCGVGVGGLSSLSVFHSPNSLVKEVCFVDRSKSMVDSCKIMCHTYEEAYPKNSVEFNHFIKLSHVIERERVQMTKSPKHKTFDLILCNYSISEFPSDESKMAFSELCFQHLLEPDGMFVMIERGNSDGSWHVRSLRKLLLDKFPYTNRSNNEFEAAGLTEFEFGSGKFANEFFKGSPKFDSKKQESVDFFASVLAPCTHNLTCPKSSGRQVCNFAQRVMSKLISKQPDCRYSYVIVEKKMNEAYAKYKELNNERMERIGEYLKLSSEQINKYLSTLESDTTRVTRDVMLGLGDDIRQEEEDDDEAEQIPFPSDVLRDYDYDEKELRQHGYYDAKGVRKKPKVAAVEELDLVEKHEEDDDDEEESGELESLTQSDVFNAVLGKKRGEEQSTARYMGVDQDEVEVKRRLSKHRIQSDNLKHDGLMNLMTPVDIINDLFARETNEESQVRAGQYEQHYSDGKDFSSEFIGSQWARITKTPSKRDKHVIIDVCDPEGQLRQFTVSRAWWNNRVASGWREIRKCTWGSLFPIVIENDAAKPLQRSGKLRYARTGRLDEFESRRSDRLSNQSMKKKVEYARKQSENEDDEDSESDSESESYVKPKKSSWEGKHSSSKLLSKKNFKRDFSTSRDDMFGEDDGSKGYDKSGAGMASDEFSGLPSFVSDPKKLDEYMKYLKDDLPHRMTETQDEMEMLSPETEEKKFNEYLKWKNEFKFVKGSMDDSYKKLKEMSQVFNDILDMNPELLKSVKGQSGKVSQRSLKRAYVSVVYDKRSTKPVLEIDGNDLPRGRRLHQESADRRLTAVSNSWMNNSTAKFVEDAYDDSQRETFEELDDIGLEGHDSTKDFYRKSEEMFDRHETNPSWSASGSEGSRQQRPNNVADEFGDSSSDDLPKAGRHVDSMYHAHTAGDTKFEMSRSIVYDDNQEDEDEGGDGFDDSDTSDAQDQRSSQAVETPQEEEADESDEIGKGDEDEEEDYSPKSELFQLELVRKSAEKIEAEKSESLKRVESLRQNVKVWRKRLEQTPDENEFEKVHPIGDAKRSTVAKEIPATPQPEPLRNPEDMLQSEFDCLSSDEQKAVLDEMSARASRFGTTLRVSDDEFTKIINSDIPDAENIDWDTLYSTIKTKFIKKLDDVDEDEANVVVASKPSSSHVDEDPDFKRFDYNKARDVIEKKPELPRFIPLDMDGKVVWKHGGSYVTAKAAANALKNRRKSKIGK